MTDITRFSMAGALDSIKSAEELEDKNTFVRYFMKFLLLMSIFWTIALVLVALVYFKIL
jgi:hypothetical protein